MCGVLILSVEARLKSWFASSVSILTVHILNLKCASRILSLDFEAASLDYYPMALLIISFDNKYDNFLSFVLDRFVQVLSYALIDIVHICIFAQMPLYQIWGINLKLWERVLLWHHGIGWKRTLFKEENIQLDRVQWNLSVVCITINKFDSVQKL